MTRPKLPDGGDAWFVRVRSKWSYSLTPCSPKGWALLIGFCLLEVGGTLAVFATQNRARPPSAATWILWATFFFGLMIAFMVLAVRHAAPAGPAKDGGKRRRRG